MRRSVGCPELIPVLESNTFSIHSLVMKILQVVLFLMFTGSLAGQDILTDHGQGWYRATDTKIHDPVQVLNHLSLRLHLPAGITWSMNQQLSDEAGFLHDTYQMEYHGIPVDYAIARLHWRNGVLQSVNGMFPRLTGEVPVVTISSSQAVSSALLHVQATQYYWQDPGLELMRKEITGDSMATYTPQPELVWADTDFSFETEDYRLAWKMEIFALVPLDCRLVYVDAISGTVLKELSQTQHENVPGTSSTMYRGSQQVVSDSIAPGTFRLRDYSRAAGGIVTVDLNNGTNLSSAVDFTNTTRDWDLTNADWDQASGDVHWGSEVAYDLLQSEYNFDSFDGQGGQIRSHIHYGPKSYANAFWNVDHAGYGDDNGAPHVGLDIVGHEIAHGIIRNTADLIYINEGAALNEGYADILGNTFEALHDPVTSNWQVGEDSDASRSMSDPRSIIYGPSSQGHPNTYKGNGWYTGTSDNGGAHGNATVFGHWYYLLAEGGTGTNDNGDPYAVSGVGVQNAGQIAWRMLRFYLTPTAQFRDAREAALLSAQDLYGLCSAEWQAVVNAWYAVGLGEPVRDDDIGFARVEAIDPCEPDGAVAITAVLQNYGCSTTAIGSTQIIFTVKDPFQVGTELLMLPNGLGPGESVAHTFSQTVDLSLPGDYEITAASISLADPYQPNNESDATIARIRFPLDESLISMETPNYPDSLSFSSGIEADVEVFASEGVGSSFGIRMEGGNGLKYTLVESFPLWGGPPVDPMDYNPDFKTEACFCLEHPQDGFLLFDRRQTFSAALKDRFMGQFPTLDRDSIMSRQGSILRVLVDDQEVGRYFPITQNQDAWSTEMIDLTMISAGRAHVCFEGRTLWARQLDPDGIGDRIFLDNVRFISSVSSVYEEIPGLEANILYQKLGASLQLSLADQHDITVNVIDMAGRTMETLFDGSLYGQQELILPTDEVAIGLYLIRISAEGSSMSLKWVNR